MLFRSKGNYIYFIADKELFQLKPYKQLSVSEDKILGMAHNWHRATVMQGEDVRSILGAEVDDTTAWYEVEGAPTDHTFVAYIGS